MARVASIFSLKGRRTSPFSAVGGKLVSAAKKKDESDPDGCSGVYAVRGRPANETATFALHDAKNLTCALAASVAWLQTRTPETGGDPAFSETVRDMQRTCADLTELLTQALAAARAGRASLSLRLEPALASQLALRAVRRYRARGSLSGVTLELDAGEDAAFLVDRVLWSRVLDNLVDNALRFAPRGSAVSLFHGRVGDHVVFSVSDQGRGVPESEREGIFDLFVGTASGAETAFGVGLAFCRRVVEAHGGDLTVAESAGGGATFVAKIPVVAK